jgi:hypothetical protein
MSWAVVAAVMEAGGGGGVNWSVVAALSGIVATLAGIAAVYVTVRYGEIQRRAAKEQSRMAEEQLRLAREEAELRPKLSVSFREIQYQYRPPDADWPHDKGVLVFDLTNDGKSAAHNVTCDIGIEEQHLLPEPTNFSNNPYTHRSLGPSVTTAVQISVHVLRHGSTEARYTCVCDEVGKAQGSFEFEVRERKPGEAE